MKLQTSATARAAAAGGSSKPAKAKASKASKPSAAGAKRSTAATKPVAKAAASKAESAKAAAPKTNFKGKGLALPKPRRAAKEDDGVAVESPRDKERRTLALKGAEMAIKAALEKKAVGPVLIDVSDQTSYTDFIGVVSGRSDRQVEAIADFVSVTLKAAGWTLVGREGTNNGRWTLLDFGDLIMHIFYHPIREVYDIEGLWSSAVRVPLKNVPPEALHFQGDAMYSPS